MTYHNGTSTSVSWNPNKIEAQHRSSNGKFLPGNPGGPGYGSFKKAMELKKQILASIDTIDIHNIMRSMVDQAIDGNVFAAKLVLSYTVGEPSKELKDFNKKDLDAVVDMLDLVPIEKIRELAK